MITATKFSQHPASHNQLLGALDIGTERTLMTIQRLIRVFMLGLSFICCTSYAADLSKELHQIDRETLTAEIWALDCIMEAQKRKVLIQNCQKANELVEKASKQLLNLVDSITQESADDGPQFYSAMKKIKSYRARLSKINSNLNIAKKVKDTYN